MVTFSEADQDTLRVVVESAERRTSAELALAVSGVSADYHPYAVIAAATAAFLAGLLFVLLWPDMHVRLAFMLLGLVALGSGLLVRYTPLLLRIVPQSVQLKACEQASRAFFVEHVMGKTRAANALLIFISLDEHYVAIVPDLGIARQIPQTKWAAVISELTQKTRAGELIVGLKEAVEDCTAILAEVFPYEPGDKNEIPDEVIAK